MGPPQKRKFKMDENLNLFYAQAKKMGLPVVLLPDLEVFALQLNNQNYFFRKYGSPLNSYNSTVISYNKHLSAQWLRVNRIPAPYNTILSKEEYHTGKLDEKLENFQFPLVIKPIDAYRGTDVFCNVQNKEQATAFLDDVINNHKAMVIEEFYPKTESYRVLVIDGKVVSILHRYPATIEGDGIRSILELITAFNTSLSPEDFVQGPILINQECQNTIEAYGLTFESVLPAGKKIRVSETSNSGRGGNWRALSLDKLSFSNKRLFKKAANVLGLNYVGFDVQCNDLGKPLAQSGGVILEANPGGFAYMHECPPEGPATKVSKKVILKLLKRHPWLYFNYYLSKFSISSP